MSKGERIQIFLDGGNFYHLVLKKLDANESDFDYEAFASFLAQGRTIVPMGKRFYCGALREREGDPQSVKSMSKQTKHFSNLLATHWQIKTSKLRRRRESIKIDSRVEGYKELLAKGVSEIVYYRLREKGIDVKLATDLIIGAVDDRYDTALVISSDADLFPAMDWVRNRKHKRIEYIGFSILDSSPMKDHTQPLPTMIVHADIQRTFVQADIKRFIKPQAQTIPFKSI
ncbi:MAG: NYN domain-containing protein [Candidatus Kerfeldbacteria bacterium]|nr:NYN domain-containing protein [Candidatus Kerfeldbacteria bacterium]